MVSWDDIVASEPANDLYSEPHSVHSAHDGEWDVLDAMDCGLALFDAAGALIRCNAVFAGVFDDGTSVCRPGVKLPQIMLLSGLQGAKARMSSDRLEQFLAAHRDCGEMEWRGMDGRWWRVRFSPVSGRQRLCQMTDISQVKRLEMECRQLREGAAQDAPLAKGLAHMGHELRTPLNAILGFSDLIRTEAVGPVGYDGYVDYANDIYNSGLTLLAAVDRISLLVKLEAGMVLAQSAEVSVASLAASAEEMAASAIQRAEVRLNNDALACQIKVFGDSHLLASALCYLLENAAAATRAGGEIRFHVQEAGDELVLEVRDDGNGIPSDHLTAIREPFVRLEQANAAMTGGVGLGLPLADRMAGVLGCRLEIESEPEVGTSARLVIPMDRVVV